MCGVWTRSEQSETLGHRAKGVSWVGGSHGRGPGWVSSLGEEYPATSGLVHV